MIEMAAAFLARIAYVAGYAFVSRTDGIYGATEMLVTFFHDVKLPIFLRRESLACVPAVRRIACSALELRVIEMFSAFLSRTNRPGGGICFCFSHGLRIWRGKEMFVTFFPRTLKLPIFLGMERLACVPAVRRIACSALELSKCCRHFSLARIAHVAGYAFVSRTDCIYGAVWKCL